MIDADDLLKQIERKQAIMQKTSYLDLQVMWAVLDTMWKLKLVKDDIYYDIDEELKWETNERSWRDHDHSYDYEDIYWLDWAEDLQQDIDIKYPYKEEGKEKGKTLRGCPLNAKNNKK